MGMRYAGYALVGSQLVPYTSNGLEEVPNVNTQEGTIQGFRSETTYSMGSLEYRGSLGAPYCEALATLIKAWCFNTPDTTQQIIVDNGVNKYTYAYGLCTRLTLSGRQRDVVSATFEILATGDQTVDGVGGLRKVEAHAAPTIPTTSSGWTTYDPLPYFNSSLVIPTYPQASPGLAATQIIDWSITIAYAEAVLYTGGANRTPTYIQLGPLSVTGEFTAYDPLGIVQPSQNTTYAATLTLGSGLVINIPAMLFLTYNDASGSRTDKTTRQLTWRGLGDGTNQAVYV